MRRLFMPTIFAALALLLCCVLPTKAEAAISGYYTYTVSGGKATITDCDTSISGDITIPSTLGGYPVTSIGDSAFYGCSSLTAITIPDSVTSIGGSAFENCSSLTAITIPDSVTSIGNYAFSSCRSLTSITIPNSVTSIGGSAFDGCNKLTYNIYDNGKYLGNSQNPYLAFIQPVASDVAPSQIHESTRVISDSAFSGCSSLTNITIPDSVTSIGWGAFSNCSSLTNITIPDSVTSIGTRAFSNCSSLTNITIPDSVTSIGWGVFSNCSSLNSIWVDENNPAYSNDNQGVLFDKNKTRLIAVHSGILGFYTIPDSVTSIENSAFSNCSNLTSVTIPDSVTSIGDSAFFYCSSLTSITIPNSVTSIGDLAFSGCSSLTDITIPDSVTSIGTYAFQCCSGLNSVTIGNGVTSIGEDMFSSCGSLISITIPDSVASIGFRAFYECRSLTSITIPDSVTSIGNYAFYYCRSLTAITIPDSVTSIGYGAFYGCSSLTSITIPDSVTSIGNYAFWWCSSLENVYFADTKEKWNAINIGEGNEKLSQVECNHRHNYSLIDPQIVEPTCKALGYVEYTCFFGEKYKEYTPALGHDHSVKGSTVQPTCTDQGYTEYLCGRCGEKGEPDWEDALGHDYKGPEKTIEPTCTENGSSGHTCIRCDAYQAEQTIAALGHSMARVDTKEPTCTEAGNSVGTQCSRCQMYGIQPELIAALGHIKVIDPAIPATCTNAGLTEGMHCSRCSEILITQEIVKAFGHYVLQGGKELVDSYSTQNDETYPFAIVDGWYESTNKDHKTTSIYTISAVYDCTLVLKYKVSSERSYDKLQILVNSTTKDTISGTVSEKAMTLTLNAGDYVYIKYTKDLSVSTGADTGYFKIDSCTQTEIDAMVQVSTDDIEPTCMQGVVCVECKQTVKAAMGHSLENGICTICGEKPVAPKITTVTMRPEAAGLYFTSSFAVSEDVSVVRKGIVVSVYSSMPVADGTDPYSRWSEGTTSVLVSNILSTRNTANNQNRAAMAIYARAYVELADGSYVYSDVVAVNLQEVVEAVDTEWSTLDDVQKAAINAMYVKFKTILDAWDLTNIGSSSVEPAADVLIISDTQTISNQTIDTDVYITSTGVATFNNVTVNGNIYCYGQLKASGCVANDIYAYAYGSMMSCDAFDGTHGKVSGGISCNGLTIQDDALEYAFSKWGKQ